MNYKYLPFLFTIVAMTMSISSCSEDDTPLPAVNEEEVITTLNVFLTDTAGNTITFSFVDLDGDGGNAPTITGGTLMTGMTYSGSMTLLNESETPAEDITIEIQEEDEEHQFFFSSNDATFAYTDQDSLGNPVGLTFDMATGSMSNPSAAMTVVLRHEPDKAGVGVSDGDITNAGGETDIEVTFPFELNM
ncbi:MAG TPA: type 1 periplasmic binding fold superfamily protein [Bacteroidetes bacterium]|nr:type 1 periplasmic binding fold superfamily protein [Bacteroidota bacterium]